MALARVRLNSGREIELAGLEVSETYGGLLEGYPCARINDWKLERLATRPKSAYPGPPIHVITPVRTYPDRGSQSLPFGPEEWLPLVYCRGSFRSGHMNAGFDGSWLTVVWFQDDLASPIADFVATAVADLTWEELAEDYEL